MDVWLCYLLLNSLLFCPLSQCHVVIVMLCLYFISSCDITAINPFVKTILWPCSISYLSTEPLDGNWSQKLEPLFVATFSSNRALALKQGRATELGLTCWGPCGGRERSEEKTRCLFVRSISQHVLSWEICRFHSFFVPLICCAFSFVISPGIRNLRPNCASFPWLYLCVYQWPYLLKSLCNCGWAPVLMVCVLSSLDLRGT